MLALYVPLPGVAGAWLTGVLLLVMALVGRQVAARERSEMRAADSAKPARKAVHVIKLDPQTQDYLVTSIRRFFAEELDEDIGELKAGLVLDFFSREVGPSVYNQAIADAQESMERAVSDLSGVRYEPEFDYWKTRPSEGHAQRPEDDA